MATIDFYFDFLSPYSYLAHCRLPQVAAKHGARINYLPIDLKAAKLAAGNTAPPTVAIPAKMAYAMADFTRWAARYGAPIAFTRAGPPDPLVANLVTFYALDHGQAADYVAAMWAATFGSGGRLRAEAVLQQVCTTMGWNHDDVRAFAASDEAAARYAQGNAAAQAAGVFGVPTMVVDGEMYWGNDRLDFLDEHLSEQGA